jgi:hypothetical protein
MKVASYCLLLGLLLAAPARGQKPPANETPFFPLKKDSVWNYKTSNGQKFTVKVAGFETSGKDECARLETRRDKDLVSTELVTVRKDGAYRCEFAGGKVDPPLCFLRFDTADLTKPPKINENWKFKSKVDGKDTEGTFVVGQAKDLKIGKKTYDAVTVTTKDMKVDMQSVVITYYFARNVGMVKQTIDIGGTTITVELEDEEAKK